MTTFIVSATLVSNPDFNFAPLCAHSFSQAFRKSIKLDLAAAHRLNWTDSSYDSELAADAHLASNGK
jgi:hypothetical protein